MSRVIAVDVGNVNIKHRAGGGQWTASPSVVRTPTTGGFNFGGGRNAPRLLRYQSGPASIQPGLAVLIGDDALRHGSTDMAIIGSAEARAGSDAYILQHLYGILASLPVGVTNESILFSGGLPARDSMQSTVSQTLKRRLVGTHKIEWGSTTYEIEIAGALFAPQPVAALATFLFDSRGAVYTNGHADQVLRKRWILDIGGGTSDWTMRQGLELVPGIEGGSDIGINNAAHRALYYVKQNHGTAARTLGADQVLEVLRSGSDTVYISGGQVPIKAEIDLGLRETAEAILATAITPDARRHLEQCDGITVGGGAKRLGKTIAELLKDVLTVKTPANALTIVADGLERMGLNAASKSQRTRRVG